MPHSGAGLASWLTRTPVDESVATLAGLAAELCLVWLCAGVLLVCLGRLPGLTGRLTRAVAVRVTPTVVRRAVEAALGLTVATASMTTTVAPVLAAGTDCHPVASASAASNVAPALAGGPVSSPVATASSTPALPALDRPASRPAARSAAPPPRLATPRPALSPTRPVRDRVVVVHRGDSLWAIAAQHLGPRATDAEIAAAWPRWYAVNRAVIGPDPDLLLPGQRLLVPENSSTTAQGSPR